MLLNLAWATCAGFCLGTAVTAALCVWLHSLP